MARNVSSWIKGFMEFSQPFNTGPLFREWGAVWQLATAVTRSVGSKIRGQFTPPNLYVLLIAGPGAGKSQLIAAIRPILIPATSLNVIPASVTRAGLIDYMVQNMRSRRLPDGTLAPSNECIALSDEMQGILPEHDIGHLTLYNELYEARKTPYRARTREKGEYSLELPYCSIITGAQPAYLAQMLPEQAWGMGFMSRSIMIFDLPRERTDAFEYQDVDHALMSKLILDLKQIRNLHGWFHWEEDAKQLYREWWVKTGGAPIPQSKRLAMGYNARRDLHFFKLAMVFSLSRTNDLVVTVQDAAGAIELLTRTEDRMRHIFSEMSATGAISAYGDIIDAVRVRCADGGRMPESDLIHLMSGRFQPTQVHQLIDNFLQSEVLALAPGAPEGKGIRSFVPGKKLGMM